MAATSLQYFQSSFKAMGTPCEIQLCAGNEAEAHHAFAKVIADVERLEARYSRYREDSFLTEINRVAASGGTISVDEETASLLDYAFTCYRQSNGLFDITSGILRRAWRYGQDELPPSAKIENLLGHIGWDKVSWQRPMLSFSVPGMELDFGGIVKEYAVDRAATLCLEAGIEHGVINLGGDIKVIGPRADDMPWQVGIRHPRNNLGLLETVGLSQGALASSGDYERCILVDGVRYGHVLNPKTGWPVRYLAAVSVVSNYCVVAGSAATIAMLMEQDGADWLKDLGLPHLWVGVDGRCGGDLLVNPN